ncbi:asparagine--tRNA ligase [Candidatus Providencia siddallii]|uniref:Asparagine--tRNA ligase n=1 Tax=Candidatus Providencia siddallii TaxID=1715285 RepID=A0ABP1CE67_9GAMM
MNVVSVVDIIQNKIIVNSKVTIQGWVRNRRDSKAGFSFLTIYDGSCNKSIQVIVNNNLSNYKTEVLLLTTACSVIITGIIKNSPFQNQNFEIKAIKVNVVGWVKNPDTYPISAKYHTVEYLREVAHLRPRTSLIGAVARIRHVIAQSIHRFFSDQGYFWITTPIITASDTEGAGEMFRVSTLNYNELYRNGKNEIDFSKDFFGREAFLSVSGQLNCEAYATAISKVYTFGPVFRAENSNTSRHLAEFWMIEPEVAFATLSDIIVIAEKMLKYIFSEVLHKCLDDLNFFVNNFNKNVISRLEKIKDIDFIQIEYTDAIKILKKHENFFKKPISWGIDFSSEHERYLTECYFKIPVIVKNYPKDIKAFYMRINKDKKTVASMDVLMQDIGEIIGGSQREERLDMLDIRLNEMNIKKENYKWYRDLRSYGTVPHSGFGVGFERLVAYVTGLKNLREVIPFPRTPKNIDF